MESDINRENEIKKSVMAVGFFAEKFTPDFKYVYLREQFIMKSKLRPIKSGSGKMYLVAKPYWLREYKIKGMVFPEELIQRFDERVADHSGKRYNVYRAEWRFLFLKSHLQVLATTLPTIAPLFNDEKFEGDGLNHKMQVLRLASDVPYISQNLEKLINGMVQLSSVLEAILEAIERIYNDTDGEDGPISGEFVDALLVADDLAQLMLQGLHQLLAQHPQLPQELREVLQKVMNKEESNGNTSKTPQKPTPSTTPSSSEKYVTKLPILNDSVYEELESAVDIEDLQSEYDAVAEILQEVDPSLDVNLSFVGHHIIDSVYKKVGMKYIRDKGYPEKAFKSFIVRKFHDGSLKAPDEPGTMEYVTEVVNSWATMTNASTPKQEAEEALKTDEGETIQGEMSDALTKAIYDAYIEVHDKYMSETSGDKLVSYVKTLREIKPKFINDPEVVRLLKMGYGFGELVISAIEDSESPKQEAEEALVATPDISKEAVSDREIKSKLSARDEYGQTTEDVEEALKNIRPRYKPGDYNPDYVTLDLAQPADVAVRNEEKIEDRVAQGGMGISNNLVEKEEFKGSTQPKPNETEKDKEVEADKGEWIESDISDELAKEIYEAYMEVYNKYMADANEDKAVSHVKALRVIEPEFINNLEIVTLRKMGFGLGPIVDYAVEKNESLKQEAEEVLTSEITTDDSIEVVPEGFTVADLGKGQAAVSATSSEVTQHEYEPSAVSPESNPTAEVVEKNRPVETDNELQKEQVSNTPAVAGAPQEVRLPGDVEPEPSPDLHGLTLPMAEASAQSEMEAGSDGVVENSETDLSSDKAKPAKDAIQDRQPIVMKVVNDADFEKYQSASIGIPPELNEVPAAAIISLSGEVKMDKELAQTILTHYNTMHRMLLSESKQELGYVKTAHSQAIRWVMNKYKGDKYVAGIAREVGGFPSLIQLLQKVLE